MKILRNQQLLLWETIFYIIFIPLNLMYAVIAVLALLIESRVISFAWLKIIGFGVNVFSTYVYPLHQVISLLSLILMLIIMFRLNRNLIRIKDGRKVNMLLFFTHWIIPFYNLIYKYRFFRKHFGEFKDCTSIELSRALSLLKKTLIFGVIGMLFVYGYSVSLLFFREVMKPEPVMFMIILGHTFAAIFSLYFIRILKVLQRIDNDLDTEEFNAYKVKSGPIDQFQ